MREEQPPRGEAPATSPPASPPPGRAAGLLRAALSAALATALAYLLGAPAWLALPIALVAFLAPLALDRLLRGLA